MPLPTGRQRKQDINKTSQEEERHNGNKQLAQALIISTHGFKYYLQCNQYMIQPTGKQQQQQTQKATGCGKSLSRGKVRQSREERTGLKDRNWVMAELRDNWRPS